MTPFNMKVVTPEGIKFDAKITQLTIRTSDGNVGILAGHIDYFAALVPCIASIYSEDGSKTSAFCGGGFLRVSKDGCSVVTDAFEMAYDIDHAEAERTLEEYKVKLLSADGEQEKMLFTSGLKRAELREEISRKQ